MLKKITATMLLMAGCAFHAHATTPSGGWALKEKTIEAKDYSLRIDVDPGGKYSVPGMAPSSVYWAQYVAFNDADGGYLGLMRGDGVKRAIVSIWGGLDAKGGVIPVVKCNESGPCVSVNGPFDWKVGHNYRFRMEKSARTPSDETGDWWQFTLADLTTKKLYLLGELKTKKAGGIRNWNRVFLEYFQGPFDCATLRHARVTMGQIKGNYGNASDLASSDGRSYGDPDICAKDNILPGMTATDYGSASWDTQGTLSLLGDQFRGLHQWGKYENTAKKSMMFVKDVTATEPYIFEALHDGAYGPFPAEGEDNNDWRSVGIGYPIINDLRFQRKRVHEWKERYRLDIEIGDYFIYRNPINHDTEYFKMKRKYPNSFPTDKTDNDDWAYIGRYPKQGEALSPHLSPRIKHYHDQSYKNGWLFRDDDNQALYIVKDENGLMSFPDKPGDNEWWTFIGYHE